MTLSRYRFYAGDAVVFPFGFGLSYATFSLSPVVTAPGSSKGTAVHAPAAALLLGASAVLEVDVANAAESLAAGALAVLVFAVPPAGCGTSDGSSVFQRRLVGFARSGILAPGAPAQRLAVALAEDWSEVVDGGGQAAPCLGTWRLEVAGTSDAEPAVVEVAV
jgi:hypothetical protein